MKLLALSTLFFCLSANANISYQCVDTSPKENGLLELVTGTYYNLELHVKSDIPAVLSINRYRNSDSFQIIEANKETVIEGYYQMSGTIITFDKGLPVLVPYECHSKK